MRLIDHVRAVWHDKRLVKYTLLQVLFAAIDLNDLAYIEPIITYLEDLHEQEAFVAEDILRNVMAKQKLNVYSLNHGAKTYLIVAKDPESAKELMLHTVQGKHKKDIYYQPLHEINLHHPIVYELNSQGELHSIHKGKP